MYRKIILGLLLSWMGLTGFYLAWHDTMTVDEGVHIASGYLALTRHDFRFDPEHPFLFKMLTAVPLLPLRLNLPANDQVLWQQSNPLFYDSWAEVRTWSDTWIFNSGNNPTLMLFLARIPAVLSLVLLGWLTYWLGKKLFSERVGLYALLFTAFNPTILAHGHLANDDVPVAVTFLLVLASMIKYAELPSTSNAIWLGLAVGVALITKFSALSLLIVVPIFLMYLAKIRKLKAPYWKHSLLILLLIWLTVWASYLFRPIGASHLVLPVPLQEPLQIIADRGVNLNAFVHAATYLRWLIPIDFIKGFILVGSSSALGRNTYLLGRTIHGGLWYYFPVLYIFKTQIVGLLLLLFGLSRLNKSFWKKILKSPALSAFTIMFGIYVLIALLNKLNIGIRHIMPILALLSLFFGVIMLRLSKLLRTCVVVLYSIPILIWFPNWLGYSNALIWPTNTYAYFSDSNLDWGQEYRDVAKVIHQHYPNQTIYGNATWTDAALGQFGIHTQSYDPAHPPHGVLIMVSADQLSFNEYASFRTIIPINHISNHTFFYVLP